MKNSQAIKATWFCIILFVALLGVLQVKKLITLCYEHSLTRSWETVEGVILDEHSITAQTYQNSYDYGRSIATTWVTNSSQKVVYTWKGGDDFIFVPSAFMSNPGDTVDVAYNEDGAYPKFSVRYRNLIQRVAWRAFLATALFLGAFSAWKVISRRLS